MKTKVEIGTKLIKTLLVPLMGSSSDKVALETAYAVAKLFDAHIDGLHVRMDPTTIALQTASLDVSVGLSDMLTPEILASFNRTIAANAVAARHTFDNFCVEASVVIASQPGGVSGVSASYREIEGEQSTRISAEALLHELTVFSRQMEYSDLGTGRIGEVLVRSGRPLLVTTNEVSISIGRHIAIAWKETAEAARALTAAMPLLAKAQKVVILSAAEAGRDADEAVESAGRIATELRWHGISTQVNCIMPEANLPGAIMDAACRLGADLLVMGGYGHSRTREFILGGVTRHALSDAPVAIFLSH